MAHARLTTTVTTRRPRYYAVSSYNSQMLGWEIFAQAPTAQAARRIAEEEIGPPCGDIYTETLHVNLRVWSRSTARRLLGRARLRVMEDEWFDD